MEAKKKTPVATGGQNNDNGQAVSVSACDDTTVVSDGQQEDTKSSPVHTVTPKLTDEHLAELRRSGISDEVIDSSGVYSARNVEALPEPLQWIGSHAGALPALVFPMEEAGVGETWQVKPATPITFSDGSMAKYVAPSHRSGAIVPSFIEHRAITDATERVVIVEGTKQALAVRSVTDETTAVFGITGITGWMGGDNGPSIAFSQVMGHVVYVVPDADAATNRAVYDGARKLGEHLEQWGSARVRFVRVPGGKKAGIDDVLGNLPEVQRPQALRSFFDAAKDKPATKMPKNTPSAAPAAGATTGRPAISDDVDPVSLWLSVSGAVHAAYGGSLLFRQGDTAVELGTDGTTLYAVSPDSFTVLAAHAIDVTHMTKTSTRVRALTAAESRAMLVPRYVAPLPEIKGVVTSPVVAPGGRIVCAEGFDSETGLLVALSEDIRGLAVPENPSLNDVQHALELLDDVFCDFRFKTKHDYLRALALLLTRLTRPMYGIAPMFTVTANVRGAGKNLLVDVTSIIGSGESASMQKLPKDDDEVHKLILSALRGGQTALHLDECSEGISSSALTSLVTTASYEGRILGESTVGTYANSTTVVALGNNVPIFGDLARREVRIEMSVEDERPELRSGFRHHDLRRYVRENRAELLKAALTLVTYWVQQGSPRPSTETDPFGSFETWWDTVGGILEAVGLPGAEIGVIEQRIGNNPADLSDSFFLEWLAETFSGPFTASAVVAGLNQVTGDVPLPAGLFKMDDVNAWKIGQHLTRLQDRWLNGCVIRPAGLAKRAKQYVVETRGDDGLGPDDGGPDSGGPGSGGGTPPPAPTPSPVETVDGPSAPEPTPLPVDGPTAPTDGTTVVFDLETGDADDVHVTDDPGFVRLAAYSINGAEPVTTTDIAGELIPLLERADTIVGHNIVQFDLAALRRLYSLDDKALIEAGKVHDTLILSRLAAGGAKLEYKLDAVAKRCGVDGKLLDDGKTALEALEEQFGGFDKIPVDNTEYVEYALQDVRSTSAVYEKMLPAALEAVSAEYLQREHEKMHALSVVESRGVRVNLAKVEEFLAEEAAVKSEIRGWLVDNVGIPDKGKAPWATKEGKQAFTEYLEQFGAALPLTAKGVVSTSSEAFNGLAEQHTDVPEIVTLAGKMEKLLKSSTPASTVKENLHGDRVYPSIQADQVTGRLSTTKPALAVFGKREERLIRQREMILPDSSDQELISVDLSQIDARCLAAGSGDPTYAELFALGRDAHTEMAIRVFGDAARRPDAKQLAHATNYGMGARGFAAYAGISEVEAKGQLDRLHFEFPVLEHFKKHLRKHAEALGWVATGFGRRVAVSRASAYTQAPAAYGQGTARDVFLEGVLNLPQEVLEMIRIFVHDEIVLSVPRDRAEEIKQTVMDAFNAVALPGKDGVEVPVLSDFAGPAESWAGCKD
ncbi:DNA polymerase [Corynebacterium oculi]|uniref:DNA-directed DNA polymerase n=1 Tax=Corynebacterium oculi TaxID=1544416 RepID=A0A0Q0TYK7_9CORY|nr:DNA polymerase [Corynebacterium oculi]KQB84263.1 DNA polymerase I, thermostable [Corynebacterium oculi]